MISSKAFELSKIPAFLMAASKMAAAGMATY